jgi:hypothetical protein
MCDFRFFAWFVIGRGNAFRAARVLNSSLVVFPQLLTVSQSATKVIWAKTLKKVVVKRMLEAMTRISLYWIVTSLASITSQTREQQPHLHFLHHVKLSAIIFVVHAFYRFSFLNTRMRQSQSLRKRYEHKRR